MTTAQTILNQLGGNKFVMMTGAKNLAGDANSLMFSIGRGAKNNANKVRISLINDLYAVEFFNIRGVNCKELGKVDGVYADKLAAVFTSATGMYTSL